MMLHFQETSFVVAPCMYSVGRVHCFSSNKKRVCSTSTVEIRTNIAWGYYYYTFAPFREQKSGIYPCSFLCSRLLPNHAKHRTRRSKYLRGRILGGCSCVLFRVSKIIEGSIFWPSHYEEKSRLSEQPRFWPKLWPSRSPKVKKWLNPICRPTCNNYYNVVFQITKKVIQSK